MTDELRATRRAIFDEVPELYDRVRPGYPAQLFEDVVGLSGIGARARVLEIGPGTGQATLPLAQRGYELTAVELGADMAAFLRRKLARLANVRVEVSPFEAWPLPEQPFDLVVCAQAFHWIDPEVRMVKVAQALRAGGALALFGHHHIRGGTVDFFHEVQRCYERFMPGTPPGLTLIDVAARTHEYAWLTESAAEWFEPPTFRQYVWTQRYSTAEYLDVLNTYSGHRDLEPALHDALFECITRLIDDRHGGSIEKAYVTDLAVVRKR